MFLKNGHDDQSILNFLYISMISKEIEIFKLVVNVKSVLDFKYNKIYILRYIIINVLSCFYC
jgi:hypothetical protein